MKPSRWELRRREVLRGLGLGVAMLPALAETRAAAQSAGVKGRFMAIVKGNGVEKGTFWPTFSGARPADGSLANAALPHVTSALAPFKDRLLFLDGLTLRNWLRSEGNTTGDNGDAHHNWGSLLTGELPSDARSTEGGCGLNSGGCRMQAGGPSIDCFVGQALRKKDTSIAFDSVHLAVNVDDLPTARKGGGMSCPSWLQRDQPNPPEPVAKDAFAKLFGGQRMLDQTSGPDPKLKDRVRLLDFVGKDLQRFMRRLGREDRVAAEAHLDSVHRRQEQLNRLLASPGLVCKTPAAPGIDYIVKREAHVPALSRLMIDLVVDAMKCGITRSACLSLFDTNAYHTYFTWMKDVNTNFGDAQISEFKASHFHALAHGHGSEPGRTMYRDANRWFMEQFAYLLQRLSEEPEGTGTMLDETLVLWADSLSDGGGHQVTRLPWILSGNVGGKLQTGRHVLLPTGSATNGVFLAIAEALGIEVAGFGDPKLDTNARRALLG